MKRKLAISHQLPQRRQGFSLVEVAIALAVVMIGLIALVGLFPQGLDSARKAADNTVSATIVQDTFGSLRSGSFTVNTNLVALGFTPTASLNLSSYDTSTGSTKLTAYFDKAGSTPSGSGDNYFKVTLDFKPQGSVALTRVTATVVWPAQNPNPPNTSVFTTQLAWYDNP